jgi:nucleoside-diphosphate kinase
MSLLLNFKMERTLVLLKPDCVQRCFMGRVIQRFEDAGFTIVGMKMVWADENLAGKHYGEDITKRRGAKVRSAMIKFLREGPVVAIALEGIDVIENVRKIVGGTEPKSANPGTIRGDFSHMSFKHADSVGKGVPNLIHASGNSSDAKKELKLWFKDKELHSYTTVHDLHVY